MQSNHPFHEKGDSGRTRQGGHLSTVHRCPIANILPQERTQTLFADKGNELIPGDLRQNHLVR